jgi:hypothetical protein
MQRNFLFVMDYAEPLNDVIVRNRIDHTEENGCFTCYDWWNLADRNNYIAFHRSELTMPMYKSVPMMIGRDSIGTVMTEASIITMNFVGAHSLKMLEDSRLR